MLAACGGQSNSASESGNGALQPAVDVPQPTDWDRDIALTEAPDINPATDVVEIELVASIRNLEILPGLQTPAWTYNGTLPGPLIRARVGDRIVVRFRNDLPEATSIHWHGLRLPNDMDGVPGITQDPIAPGEEFVYDFVARDAGTFWYHPHINSAEQVGLGLYGGILVEDPADPAAFGDDLVLILSDISLDENGQFLAADNGGEFGDLFGREGQVLLVNGKLSPQLKVRKGKPQRWRVINAARSRYFSLQSRGHSMIRLGGDNGLAARSSTKTRIVIVPGERADVFITPTADPGTTAMQRWIPVERGFSSTYGRRARDLFDVASVDLPAVEPPTIPGILRSIEPIDLSAAIEHTLDLTIDTERTRDGTEVVMGINDVPYWNSKPLMAAVGQTHIWNIINDTSFAHPFHLHGYFFQVVDETRTPEWKDTVDVPANSRLRIAIRFDDRPGVWMYHCHILDHAESGMMGHLFVAGAGDDAQMPEVHLIH
jgi:FtsP/CotA-like multicopper oxidase with cupredoxin domain